MLLWVYIDTGQAWKIRLAMVGIVGSIPTVGIDNRRGKYIYYAEGGGGGVRMSWKKLIILQGPCWGYW
jgi:hypothetical protein